MLLEGRPRQETALARLSSLPALRPDTLILELHLWHLKGFEPSGLWILALIERIQHALVKLDRLIPMNAEVQSSERRRLAYLLELLSVHLTKSNLQAVNAVFFGEVEQVIIFALPIEDDAGPVGDLHAPLDGLGLTLDQVDSQVGASGLDLVLLDQIDNCHRGVGYYLALLLF